MDDEGRDVTPAGYRAREFMEAYSVFEDGGLDVDWRRPPGKLEDVEPGRHDVVFIIGGHGG